ncbi:MAG: hypothetical protein QNJ63_06315 [Calothrix sp. MO_192.B10]|nr:hypothetical protein [Calothrix sp. MO_192.B10]
MQYVAKTKRFTGLSDQQLRDELERLDAEIRAFAYQIEDRVHTPTLPGNEDAIA